jgi:uncharacterized membrane protein
MVDIDRGFIHEPSQCPACMTKGTLAIVFNRCGFSDRQVKSREEGVVSSQCQKGGEAARNARRDSRGRDAADCDAQCVSGAARRGSARSSLFFFFVFFFVFFSVFFFVLFFVSLSSSFVHFFVFFFVFFSFSGDRVIVTGIFRANPVRHNSVHRSVKSVYRTYWKKRWRFPVL